jgi:hypothetical protein
MFILFLLTVLVEAESSVDYYLLEKESPKRFNRKTFKIETQV